jgi:NarL family two-component system response regulator LiaR
MTAVDVHGSGAAEPVDGLDHRPTRVLVADRSPIVIAGLKSMLAGPHLEIVGQAVSGPEAMFYASTLRPDIVVMDLWLRSKLTGIDVVRNIRQFSPSTAVVVFTAAVNHTQVRAMAAAGVSACVLKGHGEAELVVAVQAAAKGGMLLSRAVVTHPPERRVDSSRREDFEHTLTRRELEVVRLVGVGCSNAEIARCLAVTEGTIKSHLTSVFRKIGVRQRLEAALWLHRHPVLQHPPRRRGALAGKREQDGP